jgi:hypothetical protein
VYDDRYMEENCSEDLGCDVVRIFDINPTKEWPLQTNNVVLGGHPQSSQQGCEVNGDM